MYDKHITGKTLSRPESMFIKPGEHSDKSRARKLSNLFPCRGVSYSLNLDFAQENTMFMSANFAWPWLSSHPLYDEKKQPRN